MATKNQPARNSVRMLNASTPNTGETEATPYGRLYVNTPEYAAYAQARNIAETFRTLVAGLRTHEWNRSEAATRIRDAQALLGESQPSASSHCEQLAAVLIEADPQRMAAMVGNLVTNLADALTRFEAVESYAAHVAPKDDKYTRVVQSVQRDAAAPWRPRVPGDDE